jgi:hypothetical protein
MSLQELINSEQYYLTSIDYYLLANRFEIPCFLISGKFLPETNLTKHEFALHGERDDLFCFIVVPGIKSEEIPAFKILKTSASDNKSFFNLSEIKDNPDLMAALDEKVGVDMFLQNFSKGSNKKPTAKPKLKPKPEFIIENDSEQNDSASQETIIIVPKKKRTLKAKKVIDTRKTKKANIEFVFTDSSSSSSRNEK